MNPSILHPRVLLIGGAALFLASFSAKAASVTIPNFDFSSPDVSVAGFNQTTTRGDSSTVADWTTGSSSLAANQSWGLINDAHFPQYPSLPAGDQFAYENVFVNPGGTSQTGSLTQTLTTDFISGDSYTLSVYVGNNSSSGSNGTYTLTLYDNGSAVDTNTLASTAITSGTFAPLSLDYTPANDGVIGIGLSFTSTTVNHNEQANFNDVTLDYTSPTVPEPSSYALLGLGLGTAALLLRVRQRRS